VRDRDLADIGGLTELRELALGKIRGEDDITDKGVEHLGRLSRLETLSLGDTKITGEGVVFLHDHCPALKEFYASASNYIRDGVLHTVGN
jgi:hypothetical protein